MVAFSSFASIYLCWFFFFSGGFALLRFCCRVCVFELSCSSLDLVFSTYIYLDFIVFG